MTLEQLKTALTKAADCKDPEAASDGQKHRERSRIWVECLGETLRENFRATEPDIRVFTKHYVENRDDFGLNELLYDVCVCETGECPSHSGRKQLRYITRAVWLSESEFARDSAGAIKDFNKLALGASENKLFVGPRLSSDADDTMFRGTLLPVAKCCINASSPNVFLAQVSHPDNWRLEQPKATLWKLVGAQWIAVNE